MKIKHLLVSVITTFAILLTIPQTLAFYSDVPIDHPHYGSILELEALNLLPEQANNEFRPDDKLTIAELYKFIVAFAQVPLADSPELPFSDTTNNADYAPYVQTALDLDILNPIGRSPSLGANHQVTKIKTLETMFSSLGIGASQFFIQDDFPFGDIRPNSRRGAIAQKAYKLGILELDSPKLFKSSKRITRGEAADYLFKIYLSLSGQGESITIQVIETTSSAGSVQNVIDEEEFNIFLDVVSSLKEGYLFEEEDNLDDETLIYSAINGILEQVSDPYTAFEEPQEASVLLQNLEPEDYEGVGMILEEFEGQVIIVSPFKGSPAEEAGLEPNDVIIEVDGKDVSGLGLQEVVDLIKGPAGTDVKITVLRGGKRSVHTPTRNVISRSAVSSRVIEDGRKDIGYIQLSSFSASSYDELRTAATNLLDQDIDGLIIDLRNNPGGFLDIAVSMVGLFLEEDSVAVQLRYDNNITTEMTAVADGLLKDIETVILVNRGSASASEILAGALQDYDKATIIGETTFGKGSVQQLNTYNNGAIFKFTISEWLTPKGRSINGEGIDPDKTVKDSSSNDAQLDAALREF